MADDPSMAMYTSARAYYVRFPRLDPGDVVELQYRVEDIAPRNAFADYFGEVTTMQSSEPIGMWLLGVVVIVMFANVFATLDP